MSTLGKVLVVINLLVGAGFVYLAAQDWRGRQTITAAGLWHVLLIQGLPLGDRPGDPQDMPAGADAEIPFRVDMAGGEPTETVSPALLKAYFAQAGATEGPVPLGTNAPVPNQMAEVRRVKTVCLTAVDQADGPRARAAVAGSLLLLQAETYEERVETLALLTAGTAAAADQLRERLTAKFDQVLNPARAVDASALGSPNDPPAEVLKKGAEARAAGVKDDPERRARLAHLLVHLGTDPNWQKRVVLVVGLRRYVAAVGAQALRFREMAARVEGLTAADQEKFIGEYARLRGLAIQQTQTVRDTAEVRVKLADQVKRDQDFVTQLQSQITELRAQLGRVKADVDALLARQRVVEQALFEVQRQVGLTLDEIYRLEQDLARAQRERYGAAGKQ